MDKAIEFGLLVFLSWISWQDIISRRIPNKATYPLVVVGIVSGFSRQLLLCPSPIFASDLYSALGGCLASFLTMFTVYAYTNSGAGDVKLAAGIGAFLGVKGGLLTICYAYIFAACFALCLLIWLFGFGYVIRAVLRFFKLWMVPENPEIEARAKAILSRGLPLAPFFLIGTLLNLLDLLRFFQVE